ncbi:unnamed protein product [Trichobilharzia szidati]|nr:unnamed protein product [Trichobilharzia szidati]
MDYIEQFSKIDKNRDGIITRRDLFKYALSIGEDMSMVDRWLQLFDTNDKGVITIEDVSRTLGVPPPKFYDERHNRRHSGKYDSSNDFFQQAAAQFRSTEDMTRHHQSSRSGSPGRLSLQQRSYSSENVISNYTSVLSQDSWDPDDEPMYIQHSYDKLEEKLNQLVRTAVKRQIDFQTIPQFIALALEKEYGRNWQVIVGPCKVGCAVAHLLGRFATAQCESCHVLAFQTLDL